MIAAACDEVVMPASGLLAVHGLAAESWYLAPALARIGVRFHAVASGCVCWPPLPLPGA